MSQSKPIENVSIGFEILCVVRTAADLCNMVTRVNLLLIRMKEQDNIPVSFHYWKKYLGNTLKVFPKFVDTANKNILSTSQ